MSEDLSRLRNHDASLFGFSSASTIILSPIAQPFLFILLYHFLLLVLLSNDKEDDADDDEDCGEDTAYDVVFCVG